jgi:hypothetical protein
MPDVLTSCPVNYAQLYRSRAQRVLQDKDLRRGHSLIEKRRVVLRSEIVAMMQAAQPGSRYNSGLNITHCDGSTERSFFLQDRRLAGMAGSGVRSRPSIEGKKDGQGGGSARLVGGGAKQRETGRRS